MKSKNVIILCFLLLIFSAVLAACGKSDSATSEPASLAMKGTSGNAVNMNGTWKVCTHKAFDQQDELSTVTLSGGSVSMSSSVWQASATANCLQTAAPDMLMTGTVTAELGAEATATWTNGSGSTSPPAGISATAKATAATITFQSFSLTPNSDDFVTYFNQNAFCGKTDWAKGVAKDVVNCTDIIDAKTVTDYWVVDDSAAVLKWYSQEIGSAAYQVDSINPSTK